MLSSDPLDLALGPDGDLALAPDGDLQMSAGLPGVAQSGGVAARLVRGEWFPNLDAGVPYFEREGVTADEALLGQKFDEQKTITAIRGELLQAPGVEVVTALSVTNDASHGAIGATWSATTSFDDTTADVLATGTT